MHAVAAAPATIGTKEITDADTPAAVAEAERIIAHDPPPTLRERFKCARCGAKFSYHGFIHQPGNGFPVQPICPDCKGLMDVCLRHTNHNMNATIDILNVEGIGHLEY